MLDHQVQEEQSDVEVEQVVLVLPSHMHRTGCQRRRLQPIEDRNCHLSSLLPLRAALWGQLGRQEGISLCTCNPANAPPPRKQRSTAAVVCLPGGADLAKVAVSARSSECGAVRPSLRSPGRWSGGSVRSVSAEALVRVNQCPIIVRKPRVSENLVRAPFMLRFGRLQRQQQRRDPRAAAERVSVPS
jgi:hypothetical protein